jgi:transposase
VRHRTSRLGRLSRIVHRWAWRIRAFGRPVTCTPWKCGRRWPSGDYDEIAEVDLTDEAIETRLGRPLLRGVQEGMGPWRAEGFRLSTGEVMELIFYAFYEGQCYILRVDRGTPIDAAIRHFLEAFDLDETAVRWRRDVQLLADAKT